MKTETKEIIKEIYEIARTSTSINAPYCICMRIIKKWPELFSDYIIRPYSAMPIPPDDIDSTSEKGENK
jgi:hypothetical protein